MKENERRRERKKSTTTHKHYDFICHENETKVHNQLSPSPLHVYINENGLELAREHAASRVLLPNVLQFGIVIHKEGEVLKRDVNVAVATLGAVLLEGFLTPGKGVFFDLVVFFFFFKEHTDANELHRQR